VQLFSKISNLCDPDPPTSQTDRRMDGRHVITIQHFARSRGKSYISW